MAAVDVVVAALASGVGAGVGEVVKAGVVQAYTSLTELVRSRLGARDVAVLDAHEWEPGQWEAQLRQVLTAKVVDADVVAAARAVLALTDPQGTAAGKYTVDVREAKGVQVGDGNTQHNTFS